MLERACELHKKLEEDYELLVEGNKRLEERLTLSEGANGKLHEEIRLMRVEKVGLEKTIKAMGEKHKVEMVDSEMRHEEALAKY